MHCVCRDLVTEVRRFLPLHDTQRHPDSTGAQSVRAEARRARVYHSARGSIRRPTIFSLISQRRFWAATS
jgi:hypothetical protein